jgi:putative ABC transport system permease protein
MNKLALEVNLFDLVFLFAISIGLTFSFLLVLSKRFNRNANIFLGLALLTIVLWLVWVLAIDIGLSSYFPHWSWVPLQHSLALGPLIWLYVRKLIKPEAKFRRRDWIHFTPLILEQSVLVLQIIESGERHVSTFNTMAFQLYNPLLQLMALVSVVTYLSMSLRPLKEFNKMIKENYSDIYRYNYRWLQRLLAELAVLWLFWIPFVTVDFVFYDYRLDVQYYYPLYLVLAGTTIWIGAEAFLRAEVVFVEPMLNTPIKGEPSDEYIRKGVLLRDQLETNLFYRNSELSLRSLALELEIHPNELSRIINEGIGKNFNDLINEYRVDDVILKMQNPSYNHITLLGIAFDSGFNSKTTFNRTFKNITGKSPAEYKSQLK